MGTERTCPHCGKPIGPNGLQGLCPECMLKVGVGSQSAGEESAVKAARFIPPAPETLAPHFPQLEILELLGQGGMGAVYKARQPALDRFVALKILPPQTARDPGFAERFTREARALAKLNHPNIVAVHDFGQSGGYHYFIMEFVDGVNLRQLQKTGRLSPHEALAIVPQICDALQYAHDEGIVHRDIKPENILVDRKGRVKITDFGLAKIVEGRDASPRRPGREERPAGPASPTNLTGAKDVIGTPHYMAPEQIEKPTEVDHRADIYSLGVVFYEMLTGELPLGRFEPPSRKVQIDVRLDEVVLRALEKEPERRYQQASVLKTEVETIATTPPSPAPAAPEAFQTRGRNLMQEFLAGFLFMLPPTLAMWFALFGHRQLDVDLDADVQFYAGALGLPMSAAAGALLAWLSRIVIPPKSQSTSDAAMAAAQRWSWLAIAAVAVLVISLPMGGGAAVMLRLILQQRTWNPSGSEAAISIALLGGAGLTAALATLLGIAALRQIRQGMEPLRGRTGATAAAWFWPCLVAGQVLLAGAGLLFAKHEVLITGTVTDALTGKPIPRARVDDNIYGASPKKAPRQAWTDTNGNYKLKTWYEEHTIAASAPGYETKLDTLLTKPLGTEKQIRMDFSLRPLAAAPNLVAAHAVPPVVIQTTPESGVSDVDPALTELRVMFSKPMRDGSWSWVKLNEASFPEMTGKPRFLEDGRTCVLPVKLEPGRVYAVWINSDNLQNFKDWAGLPAVPYLLIFETRK